MNTLAEGRAATYCASDIISSDRPAEDADRRRHRCREMVARELATTLADGNYYTIRLVEGEEPYAAPAWDYGPPRSTQFTVRADIRRVETLHVRMMAPPDPLEMMTMPELTRTATAEIARRVSRRLTAVADRVRGLWR
jgi:hypothetical protein